MQKSNELLLRDIQLIKTRHKEQISTLEKQNHELSLALKEMQLDLKHQRVIFESEKFDLLSKIQKLESDKLYLEHSSKAYENDKSHGQELQKLKTELKMQDARREADILKEESRNEVITVRQEADSAILELKSLFNKENEALRQQVKNLQVKLRQSNEKLERYRNDDIENLYRHIEELEIENDKLRNQSEIIYRQKSQRDHDISDTIQDLSE